MDIRSLAAASVVLLVLGAATVGVAQNDRPGPPRARRSTSGMSRVERGRYITTISGCNDCHTPGTLYGAPDMSRQLSGTEMGWSGPWGVTHAQNLTPDNETGIGRWTEQQIVTALRTGMRPDGTTLMPPMPWPEFGQMTDEDANAVAAFLKSLPPVSHRVPDKLAPGQAPTGPVLDFPPPSAWDAPRGGSQSPGGAAPSDTTLH